MDLNLYALKTFREVMDKKSFSKAARALFLTQPAVSLQIKNLESFFNTPLLIRGTSGEIKPTREGRFLYEYALKLLEFQEELFNGMNKLANDFTLHLKLAACFIAGEHFLPRILAPCETNYPNIHISLHIVRCKKVIEGLLSGIFDLGLTGFPPSDHSLAYKEIFRTPLSLYESSRDITSSRSISLSRLLDKPLIIREEGAGMYREFKKFLNANNYKMSKFKHISVSQSNEAIISLVKAGTGFSIFPDFMVRKELERHELSKIKLKEGNLDQGFYMVFRKKSKISKSQQQMIDFMTRQIREIDLNSL